MNQLLHRYYYSSNHGWRNYMILSMYEISPDVCEYRLNKVNTELECRIIY